MGGIVDAVADAVGSIIGGVWDFLSDVLELAWNGLKEWVIEPIMNFLGFTDEDIYNTDVISVRVFDEDLFNKTRIDLHLEYMKHGLGSLEYITNYSKTGDNQLNKFYRSGKWDYMDYLPESQINAVSISVDEVIRIIEEEQQEPIFLIDIMFMTPFDEYWVKYYLQENYSYNVGEDNLKYTDGYWYKFISSTYNSSTNTFDALLHTIDVIDVKTYEVIVTTVTPIDTTTDNRNITIYKEILYARNDTGSILERTQVEISNVDTIVPTGTAVNSIVKNLLTQEDVNIPFNGITISTPNHNNERVYIVKYSCTNTGKLKLWFYNPNTNVHDSLASPSMKVTEFEMMPIVMLRNSYFNIDEYDTGSKKVGDDDIARPPSVSKERYEDTKKILDSIGMDVSTVIEGYSQNPDIDKIQDGFLILGVSPADTDPIVSRVLYEMFDFIYDGLPPTDSTAYAASFKENPYNSAVSWIPLPTLVQNEVIGMLGDCTHKVTTGVSDHNTYTVTTIATIYPISSTSFNSIRKTQTTYTLREVVYEGNIVSSTIDRNTINSITLYTDIEDSTTKVLVSSEKSTKEQIVVKKQVTLKQTRTFTLSNFQGLTIVRRGISNGGKVLNPSDVNFVIPLAMDIVKRLTILEKTALLGRSVYLTFYAVQHTHLKWYQTESFAGFLKFLTIVITVVITIFSLGSMTGQAITLSTALMSALQAVAISVGLQLALKLIVKFVDNVYLKMALSALAMVAAMYVGGGFASFDAITAMQLLQIPAMSADLYVKDKQMSLQQDISAYSKQQEQFDKKSKQNEQLLQSLNTGLTPYDMVDLTVRTGAEYFEQGVQGDLMSPSQFYYVATTAYLDFNVLYTGLYDSTVHNFVANKLTLGVAGD